MPRLYDIDPLQPLIAAGYTLLTPTQRLARRILCEWEVAAGDVAGERSAPRVSALEPWLQQRWLEAVAAGRLPARRLLSPAQTHELWRQVIAADQAQAGRHDLLQPGAAARLAARARDMLLRWQVELAAPAIRQLFLLDEDCGAFLRWTDAFSARLALLAFDTLPPLYEHCLQGLVADLQTLEPAAAAAVECEVLRCEDSRSELAAVARWAADLATTEPDLRLGIVIADSAGQRATLDGLRARDYEGVHDPGRVGTVSDRTEK